MMERVDRNGMQVASSLAAFIEAEALPGTGVEADTFWQAFADVVAEFSPQNKTLLDERESLQNQIDDWHRARVGQPHDAEAYQAFLRKIGYLIPEGADFAIDIDNIDPEIATIPGPQLVVPITNARYALNAANARWGSLYDALYGTDALGDAPDGKGFDPERGARVVAWAKDFLDRSAPLASGSHAVCDGYSIVDGALMPALADPDQFVGFTGDANSPSGILLVNKSLHIEIDVSREGQIGASDPAGVNDIRLEAAITVIMDLEDSVACVDAEDKVVAYRNWLGLMKGDLAEEVTKGGKTFTRALNPDRAYQWPGGGEISLKGRALMLVRNVGHLMTNPAVLDGDGGEVFEGLLDAMVTTLIGMHDLVRTGGIQTKVRSTS